MLTYCTLHQWEETDWIFLFHCYIVPTTCLQLMGLIIEINEQARITTKSDFCGEQMLV